MKEVGLTYTAFKTLVASKALLPQYVDTGSWYQVFAVESNICWQSIVQKDGGADQIDFETNYQSTCNQPLEYRSVDGILMQASAMFTDSLGFWVDGSNGYMQIAAGQTAYSITNFSTPFKLNGIDMQWSNANAGDYVNLEVGVYNNNNSSDQTQFIRLKQFANEYRLYGSAEKSFILSTVSTIPPTYNGLTVYIRTTYVNAGSNNVMLFVNILGYK